MSARLKPLTPERSYIHSFGALLRRLRIEAGFSQPGLSAELYTSKSTLSRAETGVRLLARDLAEACDALLGAAGTLIAAWKRANTPARAGSADSRIRLGNAAGAYLPSLWDLALHACHTQSSASDQLPVTPLSAWAAKAWPFRRNAARGLRGRVPPLISGEAERWWFPQPPVGDASPKGGSLRAMLRVRPDASVPASRGSTSGGLPSLTILVGRRSAGLARASRHTRRSAAPTWIEY